MVGLAAIHLELLGGARILCPNDRDPHGLVSSIFADLSKESDQSSLSRTEMRLEFNAMDDGDRS